MKRMMLKLFNQANILIFYYFIFVSIVFPSSVQAQTVTPADIAEEQAEGQKYTPFSIAMPAGEKDVIERAKDLYNQKDYIGSAEILEGIKKKDPEMIYWLWKNEKEIGGFTGPHAGDKNHPDHKYYEYAQSYPEYFVYSEILSGQYIPTSKRYKEISNLFPESEYAGSILFELISEYDYPMFSEGGLDERGRITLISEYQRFINRYPQHRYVIKAQEEIRNLEILPEKMSKELGFIVGGESMLLPYENKFMIDHEAYKKYVDEWIKSGHYREFGIKVFAGSKEKMERDILPFDIPRDAKKTIQTLLEEEKLIMFSETAFKNKDWKGPKFLVFEAKTK